MTVLQHNEQNLSVLQDNAVLTKFTQPICDLTLVFIISTKLPESTF